MTSRSCYQCCQRKNEFYNKSGLCMDCYNVYPLCLECGLNERNKPHPWCEDCYQQYQGRPAGLIVETENHNFPITVSTLLERMEEHSNPFRDILKLFVDRWDRRKSQCPEILAAYAINNKLLQTKFSEYKEKLKKNRKNPDERTQFHGTVLCCDLVNNNVECDNVECGICGISQNGFDESKIGRNIPRFQRFGRGIYLAPNSSKCHDYTQGSHNVRAMLVCKVALGKSHVVTHNQVNLTTAPPGYDSVYGQNSQQGVLNYDEVVVYCSEAILPTHIIVYERDGTGKIAK